MQINKHFEGSCELLRFDADKFCTYRAAFVVYYTSLLKISLLYKCTQNQLIVQVYTKPVNQMYTKLVII